MGERIGGVGKTGKGEVQQHEQHEPGCPGGLTYHNEYTIARRFPGFYDTHPRQGLWTEHWHCAHCSAWGIYHVARPAEIEKAGQRQGQQNQPKALGLSAPRERGPRKTDTFDPLRQGKRLPPRHEREQSEAEGPKPPKIVTEAWQKLIAGLEAADDEAVSAEVQEHRRREA